MDLRDARDADGEDAQATRPGARPVTVRDAAEEHRDRTAAVGDDEPAGGDAGREVALPQPLAGRRGADAERPVDAVGVERPQRHAGLERPDEQRVLDPPARPQPAVHQALDDDGLERRAVDVGVEPDVARERAVGGRHGLAAHGHRARARPAVGEHAQTGAHAVRGPRAVRRGRVDPGEPEPRELARDRVVDPAGVDGLVAHRAGGRQPAARASRSSAATRRSRPARPISPMLVAVTRPPGRAYVSCGQTATP